MGIKVCPASPITDTSTRLSICAGATKFPTCRKLFPKHIFSMDARKAACTRIVSKASVVERKSPEKHSFTYGNLLRYFFLFHKIM